MSMRLLALALALPMGMLVACGGSPAAGGGGGGGGDGGGGGGVVDAPDVSGDAPPLTGVKHELTWGPITVAAGVEDTQCEWFKLDNAAAIKVHQIHNLLSPASHHLIVYRDDMDTTEQTTPTPCQPFSGALNTTGMIEPIVITQKKDDEITLPDTVGYTFAANQMVKLEMHYINTTDADEMASATVDVYEADPTTITNEAALLFTGSPDIDIAAGAVPGDPSTIVHEFFTVPANTNLADKHIFALTGHTHKHGINMKVSTAPMRGGTLTSVYAPNPFMWAEPLTQDQAPPFSLGSGAGIDFECDYDNTGGAEVKFGESANDEMCFTWMYYYPALTDPGITGGSRVCIHTDQVGANGYDLCCPSSDSNCSLLSNYFGN